MGKSMQVDIVSAEQAIFSGEAEAVYASATMGEIGVLPGHTPLLTSLHPGEIRVVINGSEDQFYVSGGMLEVQPNVVTILADTIVRAADIDEAAAQEAKATAEKQIAEKGITADFAEVQSSLAQAVAQLRSIERARKTLR